LQPTTLFGRHAASSLHKVLFALSLFGLIFFGGAYVLSFINPPLIERAAREVVRIEIESRAGEKIDSISNSRLNILAQRALQKTENDIEQARKSIHAELPQKVADVMVLMLNPDCECRKRIAVDMKKSEYEGLGSLFQVKERLQVFIESAYASVALDLMREFRIFTASNALAFAVLGIVAIIRRRASLQLFLVAVVLIGAVLTTGSLYLFNQNWLHTVMFGDYVGMAYAAYLLTVALLFADVAFNRARVTTAIINMAANIVGSAFSAIPC
jgi:hypothetical protein